MAGEAHGYCGEHLSSGNKREGAMDAKVHEECCSLRPFVSFAALRSSAHMMQACRIFCAPFQPFVPEEAHGTCGEHLNYGNKREGAKDAKVHEECFFCVPSRPSRLGVHQRACCRLTAYSVRLSSHLCFKKRMERAVRLSEQLSQTFFAPSFPAACALCASAASSGFAVLHPAICAWTMSDSACSHLSLSFRQGM